MTVGSGYVVGAASSATVTIHDTPVVTVTAPIPTASEAGIQLGQFKFTRTGDLSRELVVYFDLPLPPGQAFYGSDYLLVPPPSGAYVVFAVGAAEVSLLVQPLQDSRNEGPRPSS